MKKLLFAFTISLGLATIVNAQCTLTNATGCRCSDTTNTNCDLLPDICIARLPLTQASNYAEYPQVCNPPCNGNDARLRLGVSTPIIGFGPLETRGTSKYVCGTDTVDAGTVANIPTACPVTGVPPHQLINQRIYHKSGNTMTFTDRAAGSMTYHPTHGHQHVDNWGIYTLRTATADPNPVNWPIIGTGTKLGFCLLDIGSCNGGVGYCTDSAGNTLTQTNFNTSSFRNYGLGGGSYGCSNTMQGISNGYMDTYSSGLDGMWITIPPGTCNGTYYVVIQIDPLNYFNETNENNNVVAVPFTLTQQAGSAVSIGVSGPTTFCQGGSVTLTASSGALNYVWSNGATTQAIVVTTSGTYTVSSNTSTSCPSVSAPVTINVTPMNVVAASSPLAVCQGQSVQLSTSTNAASTVNLISTSTSNTQVFIPDNNATGVTSPITIAGINPTTLNANSIVSVTLNLTHTYDGDLIVSLISPTGSTIYLSNRRGGGGHNFTNTIFTMSAITAVGSGAAPFTGSFVPDGAYSSLSGNVNGTWQLKVADVAAVDTGRIVNWTLKLFNTVTNVVTYNWTSNPAGFSSTQQNPSATPSGTTSYTVSASDLSGCAGTSAVSVTVNPVPVISISPPISICAGASTTLTASGANSYLWSNGATTASITVTPPGTTTYSVNGTTAGCTGTNSVTVTISSVISVGVSSIQNAICTGQSTTLNATGASTYTWNPGGLSGASVSVSPASSTTYTVTGTSAGCTGTNSIAITVNPLPTVTAGNVSGCAGTSIALSGTPVGGTWSVGNPYSGSSTNYTHTYTNANGCTNTSASANVTVNPLPAVSSSSIAVSCFGSINGSVTASASGGTPVYNYSWNTIPVQNTATASGISSGNYQVTVTDANGCIGTQTQSVSQPAVISSSANVSDATCGLSNGSIDLSPSGGTAPFSYSWNPGGATSQDLSGVAAGNYSVLVTDANGCSHSQTYTVSQTGGAPSAPAAATGNNYICKNAFGTSYSVALVAGATSYTWSVPTGATIATGQGSGSVTVNFSATQASGNVCVYASNGCGSSASVCKPLTVVTAKPGVPSGIIAPALSCEGATGLSFSCLAVIKAESYNWSFPAGVVITGGSGTNAVTVNMPATFVSGSVRVSASNCFGTSSNRALTIYGKPSTPGVITGAINEVCPGSVAIPYTVAPVTAASGFTWTPPLNATIASGQGTNSVTVDYSASFTTGALKVVADNICGSSSIRSTTIRSVPVTPNGITGSAAVCANQTGVAYSVAAVAGATSYAWTVPTGATVATGQGTGSITVNFGSASGKVSVRSVNSCGQSSARTFQATINCRQSEAISELSLFPNPAHDKLNVAFYSVTEGPYETIIRDVTGRIVYIGNNHAVEGQNQLEMNMTEFAKGVYMLSFEMNDVHLVRKIAVE